MEQREGVQRAGRARGGAATTRSVRSRCPQRGPPTACRGGDSGRLGLALTAQERERQRVSRELHDQVGQTLTVALLRLGRVVHSVPGELQEDFEGAQEAVRNRLQEVCARSARSCAPVLEDLGWPRP